MTAPATFRSATAFRRWLGRHHATATELVVRCFKVHARGRGISYAEALDEALCHGWIDGVRRGFDADSYTIRFSPRKPRSIWSLVNVRHVERLIAAGRMTPAGLATFEARDSARTGIYSFERPVAEMSPALVRKFRANRRAWSGFQARPPGYRRTCLHWVTSAKQEATRLRRLEHLMACSARGENIKPLRRT